MGVKAVFVTNALTLTAGAVAATQSGAWSVAQSGAWTVTLGAPITVTSTAQGATASGVTGPMVQGVVSTAVPSDTDGTVRPLSLNPAGLLRTTPLDTSGEQFQQTRDLLKAILGRLDLLCQLYAAGTQQALFAPPLPLN